jgi:CubicO group peptidase (beta-lactamase class C family)
MPELLARYGVPGAAVGVIRDGEIMWVKGYGLADVGKAVSVTPDTKFNGGSISKSITAWGVMRLVQQGKISLDEPVETYLRRWKIPASQFDSRKVTIRRLLSHMSGISNHDYRGSDPATPLPAVDETLSGKTGTGEVRLIADPGTAFGYSGANYAILQLVIEEVTGRPFAEYMYDEILRPLGMTASTFGLPDHLEMMATPYDSMGNAIPLLRYNQLAAAGLSTSIRDLTRFAAAGLGNGRKRPGRAVLRPQVVSLMQRPVPNSQWADRDPYGPRPQYGLGYTVRPQQFGGRPGIGHGGSNNGWEALVQIIPESGDGLVVMTNSSNGTAIIAELLCMWWGSAQQGLATPECPKIDIRSALYASYRAGGISRLVEDFERLKQTDAARYDFAVSQLNSLGYSLMRHGDMEAALHVFRLNVQAYPEDANVYDSLGEAYLKAGARDQAEANYLRSLQLNPWNDNARNELIKLGLRPDALPQKR